MKRFNDTNSKLEAPVAAANAARGGEIARTSTIDNSALNARLNFPAVHPFNAATPSLAFASQLDRNIESSDVTSAYIQLARRIEWQNSELMKQYPHASPSGVSVITQFGPGMVNAQSYAIPPPYYEQIFRNLSPHGYPMNAHVPIESSNPGDLGSNTPAFVNIRNQHLSVKRTHESSSKKGPVDHKTLWGNRYAELVEYKEANGHCNVPQRYTANAELGRWVKDQRTLKTKGRISQERIDALNKIGFSWRIRFKDEFWDKMYQDLVSYQETNGHCNVSLSNTQNTQLARWVDRQRRAKKDGKISEQRAKLLDDIGFQ